MAQKMLGITALESLLELAEKRFKELILLILIEVNQCYKNDLKLSNFQKKFKKLLQIKNY